MRFLIGLHVLLSHWKRKPGQLLTLIIGLSLATGLWTGIQAINSEARHSYAKASSLLQTGQSAYLRKKSRGPISVEEFVELRRVGWLVSPVLEGVIDWRGKTISVIGVEPITMSNEPIDMALGGSTVELNKFFSDEGVLLVSKETHAQLAEADHLPSRVIVDNQPPNSITTDIAVAERLLGRAGEISRLMVLPKQANDIPELSAIVPSLELVEPENSSDVSRLTDSFHLNLTAFGLLSFVVGLFIVHGTIGLAFEQRRTMFRTLRVIGLSARALTLSLALELTVIALISGLLGVFLGYMVAALLLPDVAATLSGLYGAEVSGSLSLRAEWWASGLIIALVGTFIAASGSLRKLFTLPVLAAAKPRAWVMASQTAGVYQALAGLDLLFCALILYWAASGLVVGFMIIGAVLLGCALLAPWIFVNLLQLVENAASSAMAQWFWADTRQQVPGLSLALMALLLALAANIGVGTMVGSFRTTFTGWLDQRLVAELYIRAGDENQAKEMTKWLIPKTDAILPIWNVETDLLGQKGKIFGYKDHATYRDHWPLLDQTQNAWDEAASGEAVLINEQLSRRNSIEVGDQITIGEGQRFAVAAIYSDYGNPQPQVMMETSHLTKWYPNVPKLRFALRVEPEKAAELANDLRQKFTLDSEALVNQSAIKKVSQTIFERTFAVTDALNIFTLAVAGFAMFTSLLTLTAMRVPQLAPVWAIGVTRSKLAWMELARVLFLAMITVVLAVPVGLALAWLLLTVVNVEAFGWELPMYVFIDQWFKLGALALIAAFLAAGIPALRLAKLSPAELVKVFAHER